MRGEVIGKMFIATFADLEEKYGFKTPKPETIKRGNARENAHIMREISKGKRDPRLDMVLSNARG